MQHIFNILFISVVVLVYCQNPNPNPNPSPDRTPQPQVQEPNPVPQVREPESPNPVPQPQVKVPQSPNPVPQPQVKVPQSPNPVPQVREPESPNPVPQPQVRAPSTNPNPVPQPQVREPESPNPVPQPQVRVPSSNPVPQPQVRAPSTNPTPQPEFQVPESPNPVPQPQVRVPSSNPVPQPQVRVPSTNPAPQPFSQFLPQAPESPNPVPQPQVRVPNPAPDGVIILYPVPQPAPQTDGGSSDTSRLEVQKIRDSATQIKADIDISITTLEATTTVPTPTLYLDQITVQITITLGTNGNQDTLTKICGTLRTSLTNHCGRTFNDCTWTKSSDTVYLLSTISPADTSSDTSKQQVKQINDNANQIKADIDITITSQEATTTVPTTVLYLDQITVQITITLGINGNQDTLTKICGTLRTSLTNKCGRTFNDCTFTKSSDTVYQLSTVSSATLTEDGSSDTSKSQEKKIRDNAVQIKADIDITITSLEATTTVPTTILYLDQITVQITITLGTNGSEDTLRKICGTLRTSLTNKCGRTFNDCTWTKMSDSQSGPVYQLSTVSPATKDSGAHQLLISSIFSSMLVIGIGLLFSD